MNFPSELKYTKDHEWVKVEGNEATIGITEKNTNAVSNELAKLLADEVKATAIESLAAIDKNADICLISVKDDEIANVCNQLKSFKGVIAHTSGSVALNVFADFENYGVFYPLQTFSKEKQVEFSNIPLCVEANNEKSLAVLKELANKLSTNVNSESSSPAICSLVQ